MDADYTLLEYPISLTYTHFSQALDLYLICDATAATMNWDRNTYPRDWIVRQNMSLSSVIHSFCAVEATVNTISYKIFRTTDHPRYVEPSQRTFLLNKSISNWKTVQCIDKFCLLFDCAKCPAPPQDLLTDLRELNNLRNWIVHGFVYGTTALLEKNSRGTYDEVDTDDELDWSRHFPKNKFNRLDRLCKLDARKALLIALRACALMQPIDHPMFIISSHIFPGKVTVIDEIDFDFEQMLDTYIENAKSAYGS